MPATISVDLTMRMDGDGLLEAVAARGLEGELVDSGGRLTVLVRSDGADGAPLRAEIVHLLEGWAADRRLPLVPTPVGERRYVLRPPAA